ncbi:thioredoxin-like protein [Globomyces pollinis-pini]|nr:thioredoxin-like protein [Globomyces pollinis-pini]
MKGLFNWILCILMMASLGYGQKKISKEEVERMSLEADQSINFILPENLDNFIATGTKLVFFGARWCKYCKRLNPRWLKVQVQIEEGKTTKKKIMGKDIAVGKVDCTDVEDFCQQHHADGFPTIFLYNNGKLIEEYTGEHKAMAIGKYFIDKFDYFQYQENHKRNRDEL